MKKENLPKKIAVFPLSNFIIFPNTTVPLNIFEPRYIEMVFEILDDLQKNEKKTIIMVEQNAKKGLEFADIGYVLVSGQTAIVGEGNDLLKNPDVGRLFLGG